MGVLDRKKLGQTRLRSGLASLGSVPFLLSYLHISKRVLWSYPVNGYVLCT